MVELLFNPNGDRRIPARVYRGFHNYAHEHARLIQEAKYSIIVAVPFITNRGWQWLQSNIEINKNSPEIYILLREIHERLPEKIVQNNRIHIRTYNKLSGDGVYTFHFKSTVKDNNEAIVGSQNLNLSSLDSNVEIGVLLSENDATRIKKMLMSYWEISDDY
jgi:phosphatidylserine/phosphatidylglycerophosphate/cardiolipin synthase-like enzyme